MRVENGVLLEVRDEDIINGKFKFPNGVTSIGDDAFYYCSSLTSINIPDSVTNIGNSAFAECSSLTSINIPDSITSIGDEAFYYCSSLTEINIPASVTNIGNRAFYECSSLTDIRIPASVTSIGDGTFNGCSSLTEINIPDSVTNIGIAFAFCSSLTDIRIPASVTSICISAFFVCDSLTKIKYGNRDFESHNDIIKIIKSTKYGLLIFTEEGRHVLLKSQKDLIKDGYIDANLTPKQREEQEETLKNRIEGIFNNKIFKVSTNFNQEHAINYLNKIINVLGINETENLLKIPEGINDADIHSYGEKLLEVYAPKYKLNGNIPIVISMLENIDTVISKTSKDVRNDRNKFYTKFNELLDSGNNRLNIEELLQNCAKEIGLNLTDSQIEKIQKELQTMQITEKSNIIRDKIEEKVNSLEIVQAGVSSSLIYNIIKKNILNGGRKENIEEIFNTEINKTRNDGTMYYGARIINEKEKLKEAIYQLYAENRELLNCNMVDILRDTKEKIGNRWILRLKNSKNNIRDLQSMTEEEKERFIANIEKNEINIDLDFSRKYELKPEVSLDKAIEILNEEKFPELLTYEKAEMMFSGMKDKVSEKFGTWFVEHKSEIMRNPEYYTNLATLHNEFEYMLQAPITNATYENESLTPELAFNILNSMEKERKTWK